MSRLLPIFGAAVLGSLGVVASGQHAKAAPFTGASSTVVFTTSCSTTQTTFDNYCTGKVPTTSPTTPYVSPDKGIGIPAWANKNTNQTFAVDLENPSTSLPNPLTPQFTPPTAQNAYPYGTRYFFNAPAAGGAGQTASRSQTISGPANLMTGVNYVVNGSNAQIARISYGASPSSSVITTPTGFTRPLTFTLPTSDPTINNVNQQWRLGGTCAVCGQAITALEPILGTGTWNGDNLYNNGTGTYSYLSNESNIKFANGNLGTVIFSGSITLANGVVTATNGSITIKAIVPSPLPILGGGIAFGWSRRLRRRIAGTSKATA